jgi:hypothetical protein
MSQERYDALPPQFLENPTDEGSRHYSYECKASVQERPYTSRPSRTQQLLNPKLKPKLASATNTLLESEGVADRQLAAAETKRADMEDPSRKQSRPDSDSDSVSTAERCRSSPRGQGDVPRKRRRASASSSLSQSPGSPDQESRRKNRRHRTRSPSDRGRPSADRRGSHRSRTNSASVDKSQVTKLRRSLEVEDGSSQNGHYDNNKSQPRDGKEPARRGRSLSPFSKRLALTQAISM